MAQRGGKHRPAQDGTWALPTEKTTSAHSSCWTPALNKQVGPPTYRLKRIAEACQAEQRVLSGHWEELQGLAEDWVRSPGVQCMALGGIPGVSAPPRATAHIGETGAGSWVCPYVPGHPVHCGHKQCQTSSTDLPRPLV